VKYISVVCKKRFFRATSKTKWNGFCDNSVCPFTKEDKTTYNQRESGNRLSIKLGYIRGDLGRFLQVDRKTNT
jgi:isopentenyldiphosphate isomerase